MADGDIPTVPVTTLAGLASVSDLLSELPICESSLGSSLYKSLLFHPRVAEEANNLLSMKDENLIKQLAHALEQTNSDHIELKTQYAEQTSAGTNINELPNLLQAILNIKPTVFKTGGQQFQQQQQRQLLQQGANSVQNHQTPSFCPGEKPGEITVLKHSVKQQLQQAPLQQPQQTQQLSSSKHIHGQIPVPLNFSEALSNSPPQQAQFNRREDFSPQGADEPMQQQQYCLPASGINNNNQWNQPQTQQQQQQQQLPQHLNTTTATATVKPISRHCGEEYQMRQLAESEKASSNPIGENVFDWRNKNSFANQKNVRQESSNSNNQPEKYTFYTEQQQQQQQHQQMHQQQQISQQQQLNQQQHTLQQTHDQLQNSLMQNVLSSSLQQQLGKEEYGYGNLQANSVDQLANYQQQSQMSNYQQSPMPNYQQSPMSTYQQSPMPNYQQSQMTNYQQQSPISNYQQPQMPNYQQQSQMSNYQQQSPISNYQQTQMTNYQQQSQISNYHQSQQLQQQQEQQQIQTIQTMLQQPDPDPYSQYNPQVQHQQAQSPFTRQGDFSPHKYPSNISNIQNHIDQSINLPQQHIQQPQQQQLPQQSQQQPLYNRTASQSHSQRSKRPPSVNPNPGAALDDDLFDSIHPNPHAHIPQTFQQRANKQLHEINEILSKSKATFPQISNIQADHYKVFPDERPLPPPPMPAPEPVAAAAVPAIKEELDPTKMKMPKVTLSRLKLEDEVLMQKSLSEFAKKSPELARKLGVVKDESDMFSKMKADEKLLKRKNDDEVKFSAPKLRRIDSSLFPTSKSTKEEFLKTQTYQQFVKNMEHELRRLEETENVYNIEDIDYYTDCIPPKMLSQLANDVAKLKAKGVVDYINKNKLTLLINFAMRNVDVAKNLSAGPDIEDDNEDTIDKILDAAEASLLICNLYATAKDVKFLQEDNMDKIVKFVQLQMRETIFPSYDPVFSIKTTKKTDSKKKNKTTTSSYGGGGGGGNITRKIQLLFAKLVDLTKIFVTLFDNCTFIDTIVLAVSTLAVEPFFVDNIETMQFACLELVTTIFRKEIYVKYRSCILGDILTSVDRLPCSKRNLRPYKLAHNGGSIQMVTALVLQLIQCSSVLPDSLIENKNKKKYNNIDNDAKIDKDVIMRDKYDTAISIGGNFLTTFLNKCKSRSGETDFRPLFENFIHDLLTTVNKPEWPASELLLSLLGTLLVKYMSDKSIDQSIRVVSLEYLGIVAARLRKDTVESRCKVNTMDQLIKCIKMEQEKEGDKDGVDCKIDVDPEEERTEFLQRILLDFLAVNAQEDALVYEYSRHFYLTQWYKDVLMRKRRIADGEKGFASRKKQSKNKRKYKDDTESSADDDSDDDCKIVKSGQTDQELNLEIFRLLDERKKYFLSKIKPYSENNTMQDIKTYIDYSNAHLIAQYLASKRPFSQSFDNYLQKIILVVREQSIGIRTKAMKCLAMIVEVDPSILTRKDMKIGVSQKFLDASISVREAAVDLVGKYVLSSSELIDQYYDMLSKRILDTGVSVRKRVIKILRDICIEYPNFDKIPEICVKMIRRVNDEEGIQKLVTEVFMRMWFTPCSDNDKASIERKINQMVDVVSMAHDTGLQWLDGLLKSIFAPKEEKEVERNPNAPKKEPPKEVVKACQQLADGLVNEIIKFEASDSQKVLSCVTTLHLLAKVRPQLLVKHGITLEPYLNIKCSSPNGLKFISCIAEILEEVVPLMEHPSETFLADLETHLMILVCSHNQTVVHSCLSCLSAVVNKITKNYKLIRDCFVRCYKPIINSRTQIESKPNFPIQNVYRPNFRRGLYTIGLILRFFDFKQPLVYGDGLGPEEAGLSASICNDIFEHLLFFASISSHNDIRRDGLIALGQFCIKNFDYLTNTKLREMFCDILLSDDTDVTFKITVLRNITLYLTDADQTMSVRDKDWQTQSLVENLCDMGDVMSGMASRVIQLYLKDILNSLLNANVNVRLNSMKVIQLVLRQGLVHPIQIVPYLICLSTDTVQENAHRADHHLQEIDKQYPGFINMKSQAGIQLSYELQNVLQQHDKVESNIIIRGYMVKEKGEQPTALNSFLYTLLRTTKPQRRALVQAVIKQFDEHRTTLRQMLYLADNLAYFPYTVQDEPLYIIHQIDLLITVAGTSLLQTFKDSLKPVLAHETRDPNEPNNVLEDEDDDEDVDSLLARLPDDTTELQKCITSSQGCNLLLMLKQHLKASYKINDGKISRYSPSEAAKVYEKAMQRHPVTQFNPKATIEIIAEEQNVSNELSEKEKKSLIERYLDFKQMMLRIDKEESGDDSDKEMRSNTNTPRKGGAPNIDGNLEPSPIHANNINNVYGSHVPVTVPVLPNNTMVTHSNNYPPIPVVTIPKTTIRTTTTTTATSKSNSRKQPNRNNKRKSRKIVSSSEEESDYSDDDY